MTKNILKIFSLALLLITSCNTSDTQNNSSGSLDKTSTSASPEKEKPEGLKSITDAEKMAMRLLKRRQDDAKNATAVNEGNMTSPYKYLTTTDEYPIFTALMSKSVHSKYIHSAGITLLAPVDKAFDIFPFYKELLLPKNKEDLDNFIAYHIVDVSLEYKEFTDDTSWRVHAGHTLSLTKKGGIHFNGAHVRSGSVDTDNGTIIGMDDLIYFPKMGH
jgi:uncharacterized surface protein with fasciclin (FAS1) repeats